MSSRLLPIRIINQTQKQHSGTVLFFHGSGDTGDGLREWIRMVLGKDMEFPHLRILYPTAPKRPYTPLGGEISNVWFDREAIAPDVPEHKETLESIGKAAVDLIQEEVNSGIPLNRIVVGGFSMGGGLALHLGFRLETRVAGVFTLSSFLSYESLVYTFLKSQLQESGELPPLLMFHGNRDSLVLHEWGEQTFKTLKSYGVKGEFHTLNDTLHELKKKELLHLQEWITQILPPL